MRTSGNASHGLFLATCLLVDPSHAQRTTENAITQAEDSFGTSIGHVGAAAGSFVQSMRVRQFYSPAVERNLKYAVLLPRAYHESSKRYPVLYLLHGHTGNYRSWITYAGLPINTPDKLAAIVVLVDGGNSFYTNWYGASGERPQRWEDMLVKDLIPHVDHQYRTQTQRSARFIGGLSMGGYGAISLALKNPSMFSFAFSSAGALSFAQHAEKELSTDTVDWNQPEQWSKDSRPPVDIEGFATQRERTPRGTVFLTKAQASSADPAQILAKLSPVDAPYIHLDVGTEDSLAPETRAFVKQLRTRGFAHSYLELAGAHEVPYWQNAFAHTVLILQRRQHEALAADTEK